MDTIIDQQENLSLPPRGNVTLLHFHQGMVLLVGEDAVGLYRDRVAIDDPWPMVSSATKPFHLHYSRSGARCAVLSASTNPALLA